MRISGQVGGGRQTQLLGGGRYKRTTHQLTAQSLLTRFKDFLGTKARTKMMATSRETRCSNEDRCFEITGKSEQRFLLTSVFYAIIATQATREDMQNSAAFFADFTT